MKKKATFFCENCQTEVKASAKFCPKCGRFFSAVKCPMCGKIGSSEMFTKGCPQCGYSVNGSHQSNAGEKNSSNGGKKQTGNNSGDGNVFNKIFPKRKRSEDSLPVWIFLVLFAVIAIFFVILIKYSGIF